MFVEAIPDVVADPTELKRELIRDALRRARELLEQDGRWAKNAEAYARSGNRYGVGREVSPYSRTAFSFCAIGAIKHVAAELVADVEIRLAESAFGSDFSGSDDPQESACEDISDWNDDAGTTRREVLDAFRWAEERI